MSREESAQAIGASHSSGPQQTGASNLWKRTDFSLDSRVLLRLFREEEQLNQALRNRTHDQLPERLRFESESLLDGHSPTAANYFECFERCRIMSVRPSHHLLACLMEDERSSHRVSFEKPGRPLPWPSAAGFFPKGAPDGEAGAQARRRAFPARRGARLDPPRPMRAAFRASTDRPVRIISSARCNPTRRGRRVVPPQPGMIPKLTSGSPIPNRA